MALKDPSCPSPFSRALILSLKTPTVRAQVGLRVCLCLSSCTEAQWGLPSSHSPPSISPCRVFQASHSASCPPGSLAAGPLRLDD